MVAAPRSVFAEPVGTQTTREDLVVENGWYESVSLSDYIGVVWRRKWIVLLVTVMVTAAAPRRDRVGTSMPGRRRDGSTT